MSTELGPKMPGTVVVEAGERYYKGGTVPTIAENDVVVGESAVVDVLIAGAYFAGQPSYAKNFANQPERTGGVCGFIK